MSAPKEAGFDESQALPGKAPDALSEALARTLHRRTVVHGSMTFPAVPALLEECVETCLDTFAAIGVDFDSAQEASLRDVLSTQLETAFAGSPRSEIVVTYDAPVGQQVSYFVKPQWLSVERTYDSWVANRQPPYFGTEPDARVWALAQEHPEPKECPVLDIGAGTGRNAFALARRGHPVDALEVSGNFADQLREHARTQSLGVRVIQRDLFTGRDFLPGDYRLIVVSEVVSDFRSTDELRTLFELAADCLVEGGYLVLNAFVAQAGYEPDEVARQLGQQTYTSLFTQAELDQATSGLGLELVDDSCVYDFEHENLPSEAWPPTGWYEGWVTGQDLFGPGRENSPVELRWLVYRRAGAAEGGANHDH